MAFTFKFPETPVGTLAELWRALIGLLPQVEPRSVIIKGITIKAEETPVAHGMKVVPSFCSVATYSSASWYQTKNADARFVYLRASSGCLADVKVWP